MALYEVEWTVHAGTPDERCTTQVFESSKHPKDKRPYSTSAYDWIGNVARVFAYDDDTRTFARVDVRLSLFWPLKFGGGNDRNLAQTSVVDEFYYDFAEGDGFTRTRHVS